MIVQTPHEKAVVTECESGKNTLALRPSARTDKAHRAYTEGDQRDYFEAETLLIDLVDSRTQKVLERNYVTSPILQSAPPDVRRERLQEAVGEALRRVRIVR